MPYIAISGSDAHEPVTPRRHALHSSAVDLERHDHSVADPHRRDVVTDGHDLREALVADGMTGRHRQRTLGDGDVQVATRHRQRPHKRLPGVGDLRVGGLAPCVSSGLFEHQLLHVAALL